MSNFNQVILMGNLTRDPKVAFLPNQTPVVEFGMAVNRKWKKEDGSYGEEVLYIECVVYGRRAEVINDNFQKGKPIFVQGRLKLEQWQKDDVTHSRIRVVVDNFEYVDSKQGK